MRTVRTVTLSTGFDHVVVVDKLVPGGVGQVLSWRRLASGKGINAARALQALGADCVAYALVGQGQCGDFIKALDGERIVHELVAVPGDGRDNLTISPGGFQSMAAHAMGQRLSSVPSGLFEDLFSRLIADIVPGDVVCFNGSLPTGAPARTWAQWAEEAHRAGAVLVADVQGLALGHCVGTGLFHAVMPNHEEAAQALFPGKPVTAVCANAVAALDLLRDAGVVEPIITMGEQGVAHLVDGRAHISSCPCPVARFSVGAGDAFLAGYVRALAAGRAGVQSVHEGLACAAGHVAGSVGPELPIAAEQAMGRITIRAI